MPIARKAARTKKSEEAEPTIAEKVIAKTTSQIEDPFTSIFDAITKAKTIYENLQREIIQTREIWTNEQQKHEQELIERNQQEEITRKREQETYDYETNLARKKSEDDFNS